MTATEIRIAEPGDPYRDPPRNWRRIGALAGALVLLWVVVGTIGWVVMQVPALDPEDGSKGSDETPTLAVYSFLQQVFGRGPIDPAQTFACDAPTAPDAAQLRGERDRLEEQYGTVPVDWGVIEGAAEGDRATMTVTVSWRGTRYTAAEVWTLSLLDESGWRICGLTRTPYETPSPTSS